jgi:hypothetical protein
VRFEQAIMISCDDNFVPMWLPTKPCVEVDDLARRVPIGHEVARMDQNVAIGNTKTVVLSVRVADTDDSHFCHRWAPCDSSLRAVDSLISISFAFASALTFMTA